MFSSVQLLSRVWLFVTPWITGLPVHHQLPEFTQTHVHLVGDAIQPSHSLSSPSLPVLIPSQHQSFPVSQFFPSGGQSIGASASVLRMNIQDWFPLGLTGLISLQFKGLSGVFSRATIQRHQFFSTQPFLGFNSHIHTWLLGKTIALTIQTFVGKVMSLLFNTLSRFVIAFFPRSKCLLISWLQSPPTVILEPKKIKSVTVSIVSPSIYHEVMGPDAMIFISWMLTFQPTFSLFSFIFIKRLFSSSSLSAIRVVSSAYLRLLIFLPAVLIPACASASLVFLVMYSADKLYKQVTAVIYSLDVLVFLFGTSLLFHVQF